MEKQGSASMELQCVGRLEIESPKPVGFLCGTIPVTTDQAFRDFSSAALVPSNNDTERAPMYRMIPTETDLNALPLLSTIPEKILPIAAAQSRSSGDTPWQGGPIMSSLKRKGEALAVSGLVKYGDDVDVIAPADILKQIFKIPYSKNRVSIAVHRVGQTLILNAGPDIEEGEKIIRRQNRQSKCVDQSLFLNFAMHSVRVEACDCPPSHSTSSSEQYRSSTYSDRYTPNERPIESSNRPKQGHASYRQSGSIAQGEEYIHHEEFSQEEKEKLFWGKRKKKRYNDCEAVKKVSDVKEKPRGPVQESDKYRNSGDDGFLRVLFWQFHNFRMLLGSDLLIFSNEKYVAVSLHLWDVSRKVTPLTWLEAWLDNFLASVPELAICYHLNGVVQGYELLKTDDIFLLKGISDDGTPAFHPNVVQQNGLSVMRFLQENCKQDPGAYWLYRSAGEDVIQLFDLSVIPKNHAADSCHDSCSSLPSFIYRGRSDSVLSLGTLLYRIAHRLSLSLSSNSRARCARFFEKCLTLLDEPDHLAVRALAHEQFARLLLTYNEELEFQVLPVESEVTIADAEEESYEFISGLSAPSVQDIALPSGTEAEQAKNSESSQNVEHNLSAEILFSQDISSPRISVGSDTPVADQNMSCCDEDFMVCNLPETSDNVVQTVGDPLASKMAAIHHISQAIKSLRWTRQLRKTKPDPDLEGAIKDDIPPPMDFSTCACGDPDCIEICDIREWLPTSKIDDKLWKLVLLLGESYLALGQTYKDGGQLYQALKVVELACLVYGSMPQDNNFISSMVCSSLAQLEINDRSEKTETSTGEDCYSFDGLSSNYLFWAKSWTLVGDVFVEFYLKKGQVVTKQKERKNCGKDLKMSSEVLKEVERLKKKMGRFNENCSSCSLINCSCRSDRASSGSSASSSTRNVGSPGYSRKQSNKHSYSRDKPYLRSGESKDKVTQKGNMKKYIESEHVKHHKDEPRNENCRVSDKPNDRAPSSKRADVSSEMENAGSREEVLLETTSKEKTAVKSGGIFKYVRGSTTGDADYTLTVALSCYEESQKAMSGLPARSEELHSVLKKKGWVCNELGRNRLERKDLAKAETAFMEAIKAFRQVEDYTNIILINCNLGHGRRALAEDMVSKMENLKKLAMFQNAYLQALETAKVKYREALRFYGAAKTELNSLTEKADPGSSSLKNEVNTQYAHTYLKLGMLLARENTVAEVYENGALEDYASSSLGQIQIGHRRHEISANDAIREALSLYESLGECRRQEAAYAHYQLACYQRDCCFRFLESDQKKNSLTKGENSVVQKVKQYSSLAERNWQKSMDFYGPKTHPVMYLNILIDRSALSFSLSNYLHSSTLLESALTRLLEGRFVSEKTSLKDENPEVCRKFWSQLQKLLKSMLGTSRSAKANKYPLNNSQPSSSYKSVETLSELYKISLKSSDFCQLHKMQSLWTS